jgi:hypothetical protein
VWANYLEYHSSHGAFDALDDLALVKNYKTKTIKKVTASGTTIDAEVIDDESLSFLKDENDFYESSRSIGFLLGCVKQLVQRIESLKSAQQHA